MIHLVTMGISVGHGGWIMWTDVDRELFVALGSDENDVGNLCKIIL